MEETKKEKIDRISNMIFKYRRTLKEIDDGLDILLEEGAATIRVIKNIEDKQNLVLEFGFLAFVVPTFNNFYGDKSLNQKDFDKVVELSYEFHKELNKTICYEKVYKKIIDTELLEEKKASKYLN